VPDRTARAKRRIKRIDRSTRNAEGAGYTLAFEHTNGCINGSHFRHHNSSSIDPSVR
jgi:hypothetical protein